MQNRIKNVNILRLVNAYREHGHKFADVNPLKAKNRYIHVHTIPAPWTNFEFGLFLITDMLSFFSEIFKVF